MSFGKGSLAGISRQFARIEVRESCLFGNKQIRHKDCLADELHLGRNNGEDLKWTNGLGLEA